MMLASASFTTRPISSHAGASSLPAVAQNSSIDLRTDERLAGLDVNLKPILSVARSSAIDDASPASADSAGPTIALSASSRDLIHSEKRMFTKDKDRVRALITPARGGAHRRYLWVF